MQSCRIHYASLRSVRQPLRYATCPAGSHNTALCLAPRPHCNSVEVLAWSGSAVQRASAIATAWLNGKLARLERREHPARCARGQRQRAHAKTIKGKVSTPGAACTASAPRREGKSQVKATATTTATPPLANPAPSATAWFVCSRARTPTQGSRQGQRQQVRAWRGAYCQRAKAR